MDEAAEVKRKGGRPRKEQPEAKNPVVGFRVRSALLAKLKADAASNGLSLSEVIEDRLTESFARQEVAGDVRTRALADGLIATVILEEARVGRPWYATDDDARLTLARIVYMLAQLMDVKPVREIDDPEERISQRTLELVAQDIEKDYAAADTLGGSVYTPIRDPKALRRLQHNVGMIDYLLALGRHRRERAANQERNNTEKSGLE